MNVARLTALVWGLSMLASGGMALGEDEAQLTASSSYPVISVEYKARDGKRCGFSKRYFLVLVACRHLTCTKTECRKMFLSLIAPLTTIRLNRGKRSNRLPYIFAQGQER